MHFCTRFTAFRSDWMYIHLSIWLAHSLLVFASILTNQSPVLIVFDSSKFNKNLAVFYGSFSVLFQFHLNRVASLRSSLSLLIYFCKQVVFMIWKLTCGRLVIRGYEGCVGFSSSSPPALRVRVYTLAKSRWSSKNCHAMLEVWHGVWPKFTFIESSVTLGCWLRREVIVLVWRRQWWFRKQKYWWWGMVELNPLTIPYFSVVYMTEKNLFEEENVI